MASSHPRGVLPDHRIRALIAAGHIKSDTPVGSGQIQPASLDVRLGPVAWRLRASFLPGTGQSVAERAPILHTLDLTHGAVLETGCVYLVRVQETLALPDEISGVANARSSIGRIDVFTRMVADGSARFDALPQGYAGPLYAEISPRTFPILVRTGDRLAQLRLRTGGRVAGKRIQISFNAGGEGPGICGYRARRHAGLIELCTEGQLDPGAYWEEMRAEDGRIVLDPQEFYILASRECVAVPTTEAAEMTPITPDLGEFRAHYAGFFDPGFGADGTARAVLEVRPRDAPFILEDGQILAYLTYENMAELPETSYGDARQSYQGQSLRLSRHFQQV